MGEDEGAIGDQRQVRLRADEDLDPVEGDEVREELGQAGLFLEILEERPELVEIDGVELADEPGRALEDDRALPLLLGHRVLEQGHQLVERLFELELEPGAARSGR